MSEELKHTPGPWSIRQESVWSVGTDHEMTALVYGCTDTEEEANARLIAAAPDLLEALKLAQSAVADFHSGMNTTRPSEETRERNERILGSIRAAIAKAEGRAE